MNFKAYELSNEVCGGGGGVKQVFLNTQTEESV